MRVESRQLAKSTEKKYKDVCLVVHYSHNHVHLCLILLFITLSCLWVVQLQGAEEDNVHTVKG